MRRYYHRFGPRFSRGPYLSSHFFTGHVFSPLMEVDVFAPDRLADQAFEEQDRTASTYRAGALVLLDTSCEILLFLDVRAP